MAAHSPPGEDDQAIGARVRERRKLLQIQQKALASELAISVQQMSAYENGHNRIGAAMLGRISRILKIPVEALLFDPEDMSARSYPEMVSVGRLVSRVENDDDREALLRVIRLAIHGSASKATGSS